MKQGFLRFVDAVTGEPIYLNTMQMVQVERVKFADGGFQLKLTTTTGTHYIIDSLHEFFSDIENPIPGLQES